MADPATWAIVASAAGAVISYAGTQRQAEANAQANAYQAQVARNNQTLADMYAERSQQQGGVQAENKQLETAQRLSAVRAAIGGNGLDPSSGSGLRLQKDTLAMGDLDARTIRANAARDAYGYHTQGMGFAAQAGLNSAAARNATAGGNLAGVGAIISGAASVSDKWANYKRAGVPGYGDSTLDAGSSGLSIG